MIYWRTDVAWRTLSISNNACFLLLTQTPAQHNGSTSKQAESSRLLSYQPLFLHFGQSAFVLSLWNLYESLPYYDWKTEFLSSRVCLSLPLHGCVKGLLVMYKEGRVIYLLTHVMHDKGVSVSEVQSLKHNPTMRQYNIPVWKSKWMYSQGPFQIMFSDMWR